MKGFLSLFFIKNRKKIGKNDHTQPKNGHIWKNDMYNHTMWVVKSKYQFKCHLVLNDDL
jgi:hypothetical protein